jgi:hypothetical protein
MFTVYAIHAPEADKLEQVKAEMVQLGAPTIEVVDCGDFYMALEGSHRLAAAHALGIEPELIVYEQSDLIDVSRYDWFEPNNWALWDGADECPLKYEAGEVAGEVFSHRQAVPYSFPAVR